MITGSRSAHAVGRGQETPAQPSPFAAAGERGPRQGQTLQAPAIISEGTAKGNKTRFYNILRLEACAIGPFGGTAVGWQNSRSLVAEIRVIPTEKLADPSVQIDSCLTAGIVDRQTNG